MPLCSTSAYQAWLARRSVQKDTQALAWGLRPNTTAVHKVSSHVLGDTEAVVALGVCQTALVYVRNETVTVQHGEWPVQNFCNMSWKRRPGLLACLWERGKCKVWG